MTWLFLQYYIIVHSFQHLFFYLVHSFSSQSNLLTGSVIDVTLPYLHQFSLLTVLYVPGAISFPDIIKEFASPHIFAPKLHNQLFLIAQPPIESFHLPILHIPFLPHYSDYDVLEYHSLSELDVRPKRIPE